ncbi:MAG: hypothetical protein ACK5ME_01535 [Parahaliea sp.]
MSTKHLPGHRRLLITWATLMVLTLISMASALFNSLAGWQALSSTSIVLIFLATGFKAYQVVAVYLNLRVSTRGWMSGIMTLIILTLLLEASAYFF